MSIIIPTIYGVIAIIYGIILLPGRKLMVPRIMDSLILILLILMNPSVMLMREGSLSIIFLNAALLIFAYFMTKGKYTITNVNIVIVKGAMIDILKDKNISFLEEEKAVILKEHNHIRLPLTQALNSVEIDLKDARELTFYKELKTGLKDKLSKIEEKVFPSTAIFYITIGGILIVMIQYLGRRAG